MITCLRISCHRRPSIFDRVAAAARRTVRKFRPRAPQIKHSTTSLAQSSSSTPHISIDPPTAPTRVSELRPGPPEIKHSSNPTSTTSVAQSSFICDICFDSKPRTELFGAMGCVHLYCNECMSMYVAAKLQDGVPQIGCPSTGCPEMLEPHYCRQILQLEVFERWGNLLCESVIRESEKLYCPYKDCSALLINDGGGSKNARKRTRAKCPHCHRLMCTQCKCPWHSKIKCAEFQEMSEMAREWDDNKFMKFAKNKKWKRCPNCKMFVEKSVGCYYIKCRCKVAFCYNCGAAFTTHTRICARCMR